MLAWEIAGGGNELQARAQGAPAHGPKERESSVSTAHTTTTHYEEGPGIVSMDKPLVAFPAWLNGGNDRISVAQHGPLGGSATSDACILPVHQCPLAAFSARSS